MWKALWSWCLSCKACRRTFGVLTRGAAASQVQVVEESNELLLTVLRWGCSSWAPGTLDQPVQQLQDDAWFGTYPAFHYCFGDELESMQESSISSVVLVLGPGRPCFPAIPITACGWLQKRTSLMTLAAQ